MVLINILSNINQTAIGGIPGNRWRRRYDPTGNWRQVEIDKLGSRWSLEDRVHDKGNRLMQVDQHEQSQQPPVEVDAAGRMTKVPLAPGNWTNVSNEVKWGAWNRIVEVQFSASVIGAYAYDALHRHRPPLCFDKVCVRISGRESKKIDSSGNGLGHASML